MASFDVIKYDGLANGGSWVAYKYPGQEFLLGSQLIVNPSQEVVFIKGGQIADVFGPGTHTLQTGNLPLLKKLVNLPFGGKAPFTAEVVYVNKASKLDMTWGTATPFQLEDPKYGIIVSIRAHGKYGVRIVDAGLFVGELVGSCPADTVFTHTMVNAYFNSMLISYIKSTISSFMIRDRISFLDVTAHLTELNRECNELVAKEFERFGIEITNLCIETISPPPSDYESLKRMKEKYAMGEEVYLRERKLDMLDKLVENPGNTGLDLGINLGAGLGVGSMAAREMTGAFREAMAPEAPAKPAGPLCPACGSPVPAGQKFCGECGAKMEKKCPNCGTAWDPSQKFCGECGTKL